MSALWLPEPAELDLCDPAEVLPSIEEASPAAADLKSRSRELRWFIDEHLEFFAWDFAALAAYALRTGLYPAGTPQATLAKTLRTLSARMGEEAA